MSGYARKNNIVLYTLDPRTKLLLTTLFTALVFIVDVLIVAAIQMTVFTGLCLVARIPLKKIFPHVKLLFGLIVLVIMLQTVFGQGLFFGLMIGCRVMTIAALMSALTLTTDMQALALGITRLGCNYRAAFIITSTFNLIPAFAEEARQIIDARKLRGMKTVKLTDYPAVVLPLMIKAMRQAQMMALAMDTRAFGVYRTRTWLREIHFSAVDGKAFAAGIVWSIAVIAANVLLKR
jgi:energy-coupling factor transport system permease protein